MKDIKDITESFKPKNDIKQKSNSELHRLIRQGSANPQSNMHTSNAKVAQRELERREKEDEAKGHHIHALTSSEHLAHIASGKIDAVHLAKRELANRGLDHKAKWVGFEKAKAIHFPEGEDAKGKKKDTKKPLKEDVAILSEIEQKHKVGVTVSEPNHTMVTKRKEHVQKFVHVSATDKDTAVEKAKKHYQKRGYKVHDHHYVGLKESVKNLDEATKLDQMKMNRILKAAMKLSYKVDGSNLKQIKQMSLSRLLQLYSNPKDPRWPAIHAELMKRANQRTKD